MEAETSSLRSLVAQLESELKEKDKDIHTAAEFGKKLLESNQELQNQLDENAKSYSERIECLEQDKFSLQQKLEAQKATLVAMQQEFESTTAQLEQKHSRQLKYGEELQSRKVHELSKTNNDQKAEIEKLEVQVKTCTEKARIQERTIEQLREDLNSKCNTTVLQHELKDLEQLYADEKSHSEELRLLLAEGEGNVEMLSVEVAALQEKVAGLEEECQDRCRMANEWYEALKESKDQNVELTCQLEALKMEAMGEGHQKSGNSLFGEVDDRRMQVERKMISLKVRYETLEKTHATTQHQLRKMKADMSALLCHYGATSADAAHTARLQRALAQCKSENETLLSKLHRLEKQQVEAATAQQQRKCVSAFVDFGNKAEYIQFLEQELEEVKRAHKSVINELDLKRTQLLWESNKLSEAEAKIHHTEQELAKVKKEYTTLRMKLQESTEKLTEVDMLNKQLAADKAYLEEQLKARGTKKRLSEVGHRKGQEKDSNLTKGKNGVSQRLDPSLGCLSEVSNKTFEGEVSQKETQAEDKLNSSKVARTTVVKKEINILDDLDREFCKQRQEQQRSVMTGGWHPGLVKELGGLNSERQNATDSRANSENTEASLLNATHPTSVAAVPAKVIHVSSKETVNKCPQQ